MPDNLFHIIEDAHVILLSKGVYKQSKVYRRGDRLFAGYGAGFIRLGGMMSDRGETSCPGVSYETLDLPFVASQGPGRVPLFPTPTNNETMRATLGLGKKAAA